MEKTILLMGGTGFIGSALGMRLAAEGWSIHLLTRKAKDPNHPLSFPCKQFSWEQNEIPSEALEGISAVINLVGQPIADHPWTASYKNEIITSRIRAVQALKNALLRDRVKPQVIIQASAIGYYGFPRDGECNESSQAGHGFLSETCQIWEKEAQELGNLTRLCIPRLGLVLGWGGGAFPKLHDIYSSGFGAVLGNGKQWMNWVHGDDVVNFCLQAIREESYEGVFNLVAPVNSTNREFHREMSVYAKSLCPIPVPKLALKVILGERASLVLEGPRIIPQRLQDTGFRFQSPTLSVCLKDLFSGSIQPRAHVLEVSQWLPVSGEEMWDFIATPENLEKITPPWLQFKVLKTSTPELGRGSTIDYALKLHGLPLKWRSLISHWEPMHGFVDEQMRGPYSLWHHRHSFVPLGMGTLVIDRVEFRLPWFPFGEVSFPFVQKDLHRIFQFRQKKMAELMVSKKPHV